MTETATPPLADSPFRKFKISGDVINRATENLPDEQRSIIRWFHGYCYELDLPLSEAAKLARYDESTLHRVLNGRYEGNMANVCANLAEFKKINDERQKARKLPFVQTTGTKRMFRVFDAARETQRMSYIFGDSQTGKTTAALKYVELNNHGSTKYLRMPTGGAMGHFLENFAVAMRLSPQLNERELRRRIISAFDDRMLLIIDEAHQCFCGGVRVSANQNIRPIEFVREIHDVSKCGVVIIGTNVFRDEMENGQLAGVLKQCKRRRLVSLLLPATPTVTDLNAFSAEYGLPPAEGDDFRLQSDVIRDEALGMWLSILRMGAKLAVTSKVKMSWGHVQKAYKGLLALEGCK